jgi:hypothetical protein
MRFAPSVRIASLGHGVGLLGNVIGPIQLAFSPDVAGIADIGRPLQLNAGRIVICSANCLAIHTLAADAFLLTVSVSAQL